MSWGAAGEGIQLEELLGSPELQHLLIESLRLEKSFRIV